MKLQQYSIVLFFFLGCLGLGTLSYLGHFNNYGGDINKPIDGPKFDEVNESYLKNSEYYYIDKNKPAFKIDSDELTLSATSSKVFGFNPVGIIYREIYPIFFQSKNFQLFLKKKEIILENKVEASLKDTKLYANKIHLYSIENKLEAEGSVQTVTTSEADGKKIVVYADFANGFFEPKSFEYKGSVVGTIKRKKLYEKDLTFKTDFMSYTAASSQIELKGNVELTKENFKANALRGQIFIENYNKKLKYYALYDDVKLEERVHSDGHLLERKAFAERLEGIMSERKIILTGYPKVFQEKDVIKGNRITIRENIETVEVDDANTSILLRVEEGKGKRKVQEE